MRIDGDDDNHHVDVDVDKNEEQQHPKLLLLCGPNVAEKMCELRSI